MSQAQKQGTTGHADEVRRNVSDTYTRAVTQETSCCGPKGVAATMAGYGRDAPVPVEALRDSFGCGNPLAFSGVKEGDTVLDLGSGAGLDLLLAAQKVGPGGRVLGVDMTDEMIARARARVAEAGHANIEVRKGLIEDLPVETGTVDWVISNCVINLSPEKDRVFAEIARVLRPGGQMLVSDIVADDLPAWARESAEIYASCVGGAISEAEYLAGLARAGLVDARVVKRFAYDAESIAGMVESELPHAAKALSGCCGGGLRELATRLQGKVASVSVYAQKPV